MKVKNKKLFKVTFSHMYIEADTKEEARNYYLKDIIYKPNILNIEEVEA